MNRKAIIQEILVGGLSGLALVLVYILIRSHLDGADPGDWLQFAGAMLGSGSAVAGGVFLERMRRKHDEDRGKATLLDALTEVSFAIHSAKEPLEGDLSKDVSQINARRYLLEVAKEFLEFVLKDHIAPSSRVWRRARGLGHRIALMLEVKWYEYDPQANEDMCGVGSVADWHKEVTRLADSILPIIDEEIAEMKKDAAGEGDA